MTKSATAMNNPWMIAGLSVLLCLYLAFGLMGCAWAGCDDRMPPAPWTLLELTPRGWERPTHSRPARDARRPAKNTGAPRRPFTG